ncbi:MAG TPA: methyltransferase domain-containing protein, partial [Rhodospirillales bacterium]|nr:methyltransferase domain-containing protein [Rhodospirillales bacterium]
MSVAAANSGRKAQVASSFGAVSEGYATAAGMQRLIAGRLAGRISDGDLPDSPRVLEVGCGTGFLTEALRLAIGGAWVVSDIAAPMVESCRSHLGDPGGAQFLVMDAERPAVAGGFDLVCSNLVFQWLDNLQGCIRQLTKLLAPGGRLAFST